MLEHFRTYWDACANTPAPIEARQQLVGKIIDRVLVYDDEIIAVILHGNFAVVLGANRTAPAMVADAVSEVLVREGIDTSLDSSKCGSDGLGYRTCYLWTAFRIDYHIVVDYWLERLSQRKNQTQNPQSDVPRNSISNSNSAQAGKVA